MEMLFEPETEKCLICQQFILIDLLSYHLSNCRGDYQNSAGQMIKECYFCPQNYPVNQKNQHQETCLQSNLRKCKKCLLFHPVFDLQNHQKHCARKRRLIKKTKLKKCISQ